ncbi:MAG: family N-acetyltransferase [Gammaproteobacteria bacterium]|nr:family N-acetyltransferase [Gammaproteobacteria bacterium]
MLYSKDFIAESVVKDSEIGEFVKKFEFKPLQESDIDLLYRWLSQPHVAEIWYESLSYQETRAKYLACLTYDWIFLFIVYYRNQPIGYIHYYYAEKVGHGWWPDAKPGEAGLDLFIGEQDYLDKGYGTALLKEFIKKISADPKVHTLFVDVELNNLRAQRCYEKAGFISQGEINTPAGKAILMAITV